MSIERLLTVRYWKHHTRLDWRSKHKRKQQRQFICSILFIFLAGIISQHPNYLNQCYESFHIDYKHLMFVIKRKGNILYGYYQFNEIIFTIISYLILDTTMPLFFVLFINILLLREVRKLPLALQLKVKESIGILFFLTALSIAILPRVFIAFYTYYSLDNNSYLFNKLIFLFYICLGEFPFLFFSQFFTFIFFFEKGFEYFNHAITGYACFLQSALLRSELKNMIWTRYIASRLH